MREIVTFKLAWAKSQNVTTSQDAPSQVDAETRWKGRVRMNHCWFILP
jgi:hypothetical protein